MFLRSSYFHSPFSTVMSKLLSSPFLQITSIYSLFLFPRIHLQSQFELQYMAITKEIKYYYPHLQAFWPHSSWLFYFQYPKCSTPSVPLKKYLLHYWMHYSLEEDGEENIIFQFMNHSYLYSSPCTSSSYGLLNYFWTNTVSQTWNTLFCYYFYQCFYPFHLQTMQPHCFGTQ